MTVAHTPGPWTPKLYEAGDCWRIHFDFKGVPTGWLGEVYIDSDPVTAEADARLIAAAPELLEALQLARAELNRIGSAVWADTRASAFDAAPIAGAVNAADAAIAKATGDTPA